MICSICEEVSQVPTGTRIPIAFINTLWDRRLESGRQRGLDLLPQGSALPPKRMVTVEESTCLVSSGAICAWMDVGSNQAVATTVASISITSANPATIRICMSP
jgi:hypothetical protein